MPKIRILPGMLIALSAAAHVHAGEAVFYVTEDGKAVSNIAVSVDGSKKLVQQNGFVTFDVSGGTYRVELTQMGEVVGEFELTLDATQNAEVKVDLLGGEAVPSINLYGAEKDTAAVGKIIGMLRSAETGGALEGARVSIDGTDMGAMSDAQGQFELSVPRGAYDLTISHPNYGKKSSKNVRVFSGAALQLDVELSMSSTGVIEEVVATGAYLPVTDVAQKRDASSILESINNEQFSKMGDSDAASALKRVSGVSLVGGQYAVVRGLGGRYISSSLNGGSLPSTNPLSREVALDLFPASVLKGIEIHKGYTPNLPGDSTGGAINMVTKGLPDERTTRVSVGTGVRTGVTNKEVLSYDGGDRDMLGFDDDTREMPGIINGTTYFAQRSFTVCDDAGSCLIPEDAATLGKSLDNNYNTHSARANPDVEAGIGHGDLVPMGNGNFGYYGDASYKHKWTARQDARVSDDSGDFEYDRSRRNIDINAYGVIGYQDDAGDLELLSKTMLLRKTDDITRRQVGTDIEGTDIDETTLQWTERSYLGQTFSGQHMFDDKVHELEWQTTIGQSTVSEPDRRTYQFRNQQIFPSTLERRYSEQTDDSKDIGLDYTFNAQLTDTVTSKLMAGMFVARKDRETFLGRLGFNQGAGVDTAGQDLESLLTPARLDAGDFTLAVRTAATDSYEAEDNMDAFYLNTETTLDSAWTVLAGVRFEDAEQTLSYPGAPLSDDVYKTEESLPAFGLTWRADDQLQLRGAFTQTVSRPGLTERSLSSLYDPETDEQVFGNRDLELSSIDNIDLRAEYYFDDVDNVSVGVFSKKIDKPIERTVPDASGSASQGYTFLNQKEAEVSGIELDFRKSVFSEGAYTGSVGGNLSFIDSEVTLTGRSIDLEGGDDKRKLQGQSDRLANLQFGLVHEPTQQDLTVLVNYFDDRIAKVGRAGRHEIEEGRPTVDVVYRREVDTRLTVSGKIQNLFNQKVEYSTMGDISESYTDGTYFNVGLSYSM